MSATTLTPIAGRFAWKEYRMLRGFWLAVAGLTVLEQGLSTMLAPPGINVPSWLFGSALFAAALYAVGAAATSFAVEHEEQTYDYLSGLPSTWPAVFIGKLLVTLGSAFALAAVLTITGLALGGPPWSRFWPLVGLFGVAIFEAVAWGTLFSLLMKRPLVAAILTLIVTTLAIHLAVNITGNGPLPSIALGSYSEAIPTRLAIVAGVLVLCVLLARSWLAGDARRARAASDDSGPIVSLPSVLFPVARILAFLGRDSATHATMPRRRMFARLLWQTWCESWKMLFMPLLITGFAIIVIVLLGSGISDTSDRGRWVVVAPSLAFAGLLPALYGALVFHADQRRRQYRFLAEHAAGPRWVWLARQCVWGGTLLALLLLVLVVTPFVVEQVLRSQQDLRYLAAEYLASHRRYVPLLVALAASTALFAGLLPYAIGQLCSMTLRSAIISVFLAVVLTSVAAAWTAAAWAWELNAWFFLLLPAVGLLVATWLRAPDWLAERHSWRSWWKPAAAVAGPIALVVALLPIVRLAQLPAGESLDDAFSTASPALPYDPQDFTAAEQQTVDQLQKALAILDYWRAKNIVDDPARPAEEVTAYDEAWSRYHAAVEESEEKAKVLLAEASRRYFADSEAAARQTGKMYLRAIDQVEGYHRADFKLILEATQRPTCRFDFDWSALQVKAPTIEHHINRWLDHWPGLDEKYVGLSFLSGQLPKYATSDAAVDRYIAALRMCAHLRQHVPTSLFINQLRGEQMILESFARWAQDDARTDAELAEALDKLQAFFDADPLDVSDALDVDRRLVRDVIEGHLWPLSLDESPESYLAYLANQLPWERARALRALELIHEQNVGDVRNFQDELRSVGDYRHSARLSNWLQPRRYPRGASRWVRFQPAAATSYLTRNEYEARVPMPELVDMLVLAETHRQATLLEIALARYRLAHEKYPQKLTELVPDSIDRLPIDPNSGRPFEYRPDGLDLTLRTYYPVSQQIAAHTPMFWSVGPGGSSLQTREFVKYESNTDDPLVGPIELDQETYYVFQSQNPHWNNWFTIVFPLPK